jgi:hypothetical protein
VKRSVIDGLPVVIESPRQNRRRIASIGALTRPNDEQIAVVIEGGGCCASGRPFAMPVIVLGNHDCSRMAAVRATVVIEFIAVIAGFARRERVTSLAPAIPTPTLHARAFYAHAIAT